MSKPEVVRYKYGYKDDGWGQRFLALIEDAEGAVVRFSDHEEIAAQLREERDSFQRAGIQSMAERNELLGLLRYIKAELLRRGEKDSDGCTVVNLGNGLWCRIDATLERHKC